MRTPLTLAILILCATSCPCAGTHVSLEPRDGHILAKQSLPQADNKTPLGVVITYRTVERGRPMGGYVIILKNNRPIWRHPCLNPWKLEIADVDGDGQPEICLGVYKKSPRDPIMAKRSFFYNWDGTRMVPKWLGSRLARRFDDFTLADLNHDGWDELVSLEVAPKGMHRLSIYRWKSFGFEWLASTKPLPITRIRKANGQIIAIEAKGHQSRIAYQRGRLRLLRGPRVPADR